MMTIKNYVRAQSLQQAYELNQNKRNRILGGMLWLKMTDSDVTTAIDLSDLGLDTIEETEDSFSIGAMVTLRQLELHEGLNAYTGGAMAKAVRDIIGVQFRNMATVGGSIFGRYGFSDVLTLFLALDCQVELYQAGLVPLEQFAGQKADRDLLVRLVVKKRPVSVCYQVMRNSRTDFPVLTCCLSCLDGEWKAVYGARPGRAMVLRDETGILASGVTGDSAHDFACWAAQRVPTGSNLRGSAAYRSHLVKVLTQRGLAEAGGK